MPAEQRFRYGAKPALLALVVLFFGGAGVLFVWLGSTGQEVRLWPLPMYATGGPVYVLAAVAFAFPVVAIAQAVRGRSLGPRELVITDAFIEAPRGPWRRETIRIERAAIRSVQETETMGTRVVVIESSAGKLALSNRTVGKDGYEAALRWLDAARTERKRT